MHSTALWGLLAISCLAVTTVLCQDAVENCFERIAECKKGSFNEMDEIKRVDEMTKCLSSFKCKPGEDTLRDDLIQGASARIEAVREFGHFGGRFRDKYGNTKNMNMAPTNKVTLKFIASCLFAVLGVTQF
ncbi:unnamed protein product [Lymnaea stagnalis]|uniref:Secreted protein n=1 Tax=Lymnaea stagnalis TaxID=6523 RepID=A0AAV2H6F0_LYMST